MSRKVKMSKKERHDLSIAKMEKHKRELEQVYQSALVVAMHASCLYLRDKQGYGKKRLGDFVEGFAEIVQDISDGYLDFEDIINTIEEETGIKIQVEDIYGNKKNS